jgi:tetratricopeptide (TPR) repeat protein
MADELKPLDGDLGGPAPQDPLPTAALPRKKMSLQAKLIAGGVAAAVLLLVVGGIWIWGKVQQRDATELVSRIYRAAQENYQKGEFADAAKGFESVLKNPHRVPGTSESSVLVHMAKANVAVETAMKGGSPQEKKVHWDEAASFESSARKQLENVQATAPELYNWTRQIKDDLDKFARYRTSSKTFDDGMTAAAALLAEGKYQSARDVLTAKLSVPDLTLTDAQARRAADLRSAITVAEVKSAVERRFKNVPELMNANDWPAVKAELDEIDKQLKENAERLPGADYRAFSERLADLNVKLSGEQKRGQLAAKAEKCRSEGDIAGELAALEELQKDWPTPELSQRITGVKARQLHEQAKALAKDGKVAEAREAYGRLLQMRPGDKAVQSELDALNTAARRVDLIRDGDASLAAGDLPKALTSFVEANKIQTDNETSEKIRGIRFRMQMAEAGRLRDEKKYREAIAAYEKARADYPTGAAEVDAQLATIARSQQYEGLLAEGDKLFDGRQWGKSREAYQKAQKVSSTDEVKQRIAMTFYGEYVELGRSAYDEKNYSSALGYFRIAQKSVDTPEIKALIAQAEKAMKGQ